MSDTNDLTPGTLVLGRYWTLERPDGTPNELIGDDRVKHYRTADAYRQGYRVKGPFVREADYEGAVEALRFYADPATWDTTSPHGTVTTDTPARRDGGQRARNALGGQQR